MGLHFEKGYDMDKIEAAFRENINDKDSMNKDYEDIFIGKGINNTLKADLAYEKMRRSLRICGRLLSAETGPPMSKEPTIFTGPLPARSK